MQIRIFDNVRNMIAAVRKLNKEFKLNQTNFMLEESETENDGR